MSKVSKRELEDLLMDIVDEIGDLYATLENMRQVKAYVQDKEAYTKREIEIKNEIAELNHRFNQIMILIQANTDTKTMRLSEDIELKI